MLQGIELLVVGVLRVEVSLQGLGGLLQLPFQTMGGLQNVQGPIGGVIGDDPLGDRLGLIGGEEGLLELFLPFMGEADVKETGRCGSQAQGKGDCRGGLREHHRPSVLVHLLGQSGVYQPGRLLAQGLSVLTQLRGLGVLQGPLGDQGQGEGARGQAWDELAECRTRPLGLRGHHGHPGMGCPCQIGMKGCEG